MCNGFGMIVSGEIKGYFTMPDSDGDISHSDILRALGWKDNEEQFNRRFVRIECPNWTIDSFRFDERESLPGWAEENTDAIKAMVERALSKAAPAYAEYERVRDAAYAEYKRVTAPAYAEYKRVTAPAEAEYKRVRDAAYAEYKRVRDAAYAEYERVRDAAYAEYERVSDAAYAEYKRVTVPAYAEYERVRDAAVPEYERVRDAAEADLRSALQKIDGFVY